MSLAVWCESSAGAGREVCAVSVCVSARVLGVGAARGLRVWSWVPARGWVPAAHARAAHRHALTTLAWAPHAALLASAGLDRALRFWALPVPPLLLHVDPPAEEGSLRLVGWASAARAEAVRSLVWGRDADMLLAGHADGCIMVWRIRPARRGAGVTSRLMARLRSHDAALHALTLLARDTMLLACCMDGVLKLWCMQEVLACGTDEAGSAEAARAPRARAWRDAAHELGALCAAPCGRRAVTAGHDHVLRVWSVTRTHLRLYTTLEGHESGVTDVRWAARAHTLVSVSLDRTARVWTLGEEEEEEVEGEEGAGRGSCVLVVAAHSRYITSLALDPDARFFITGSNDKSFKMWSLGNFSLKDDVRPPCNILDHFGQGDLEGIEALPVVSETQRLEEPTHDNSEVRSGMRLVWRGSARGDAGEGGARRRGERVASVACAHPRVATVVDSEVCVWDMSPAGTLVEVWRRRAGRGGGGASLAWLCGGQALLSAVSERVTLWDAESGEVLREFGDGGEMRGVAGSGTTILLAGEKTLELYQLENPRPLHVWEGGGAWCGALGAGGRVAAAGEGGGAGGAGEGRLCVLATSPPYRLLAQKHDAHHTGVECVSFAPSSVISHERDGGEQYALATAGNDEYIKMWLFFYPDSDEEEASLVCTRRVAAHGGGALRVSWCGRVGGADTLVSGGADGWLRVWGTRGARGALPAQAPGMPSAFDTITTTDGGGAVVVCADEEGSLCMWALGEEDDEDVEEEDADALWSSVRGLCGVTRWVHTHVLTPAGVSSESEWGVKLLAAATNISGARLLDDSIPDLMEAFGLEDEPLLDLGEDREERSREFANVRERLQAELEWIKIDEVPHSVWSRVPEGWSCSLRHGAGGAGPLRAPDGLSYCARALASWTCAYGDISPASGARWRRHELVPNTRLRDSLRRAVQDHTSATARTTTTASY